MKQVLFIGDIHGRSEWWNYASEALNTNIEIVFLGDYTDSEKLNGHQVEQNLLRIINFKQHAIKKKKDVTLLLGNHDYAYLMDEYVTGKNDAWTQRYKEIFNQNWDLFDLAWGYRNYFYLDKTEYTLATHAGITEDFWQRYILNNSFVKILFGENAFKEKEMHEILNVLKDKFNLLWKVGKVRGGVDTPGPLWADFSELKKDPYPNINQVVGHSQWLSPELVKKDNYFIAKVDGLNNIQRLIIDF